MEFETLFRQFWWLIFPMFVFGVFTFAGLCFAVLDLLGLGASASMPLMSVACLAAVAFETVAWANERRSLILGGVRLLMR